MRKHWILVSAAAITVAGFTVPTHLLAQDNSGTNNTGTSARPAGVDSQTPGSANGGPSQIPSPSGGATNVQSGNNAGASAGTNLNSSSDATLSGSTALPNGQQVSADDAKAIRSLLSQATGAAVTKDNFHSLERRLTKADRDRLRQSNVNNDDLNTAIDQFNSDWKAKYGNDFKISDADDATVFNDQSFRIYQGDLTDQARTASERYGPSSDAHGAAGSVNVGGVTASGSVGTNGASGSTSTDANSTTSTPPNNGNVALRPAGVNSNTPGSANGGPTEIPSPNGRASNSQNNSGRTGDAAADASAGSSSSSSSSSSSANATAAGSTNAADKDTATVWIPANSMQGPAALRLVREGGIDKGWKIALPQTVDAQRLHDNLLATIQRADANKAQWPADQNDAYRSVAGQVLTAISGSPSASAGAATGAGYTTPSDRTTSTYDRTNTSTDTNRTGRTNDPSQQRGISNNGAGSGTGSNAAPGGANNGNVDNSNK